MPDTLPQERIHDPSQDQFSMAEAFGQPEEPVVETPAPVDEKLARKEVFTEVKPDYEIFSNPYERMEYMHLTDDLIATLDGSDEYGTGQPYDAVIYLDSSARPVDWMVRGLWDFAARKDETGKPVERPDVMFANIDARRSAHNIAQADTDSLAATYPLLRDAEARTEPMRVLVVDEIAVSGDTIGLAVERFQAAYPSVNFDGYAWKDERNSNDLNNVRWYERGVDRYRAVLDPTTLNPAQREQLAERKITSRKQWLSVINPDQTNVKRLRGEVDRMVEEVKAGRMPFWPSGKRPDDDQDALIRTYNENLTPQEFMHFRDYMKRHYAPSSLANFLVTDATGPLSNSEARKYLSERERDRAQPTLTGAALDFAKRHGFVK